MPPARQVRRWGCCCTGLAHSRCAASVCCAELVLYSAADALLAAAIGFCLRQFAPEKPGAGMLLVGAAAAAALGSVQLWQLQPGVIVCAALELYLCSKAQVKAALAASAVLGAALCAADPALSFAAAGLACATAAAVVLAPGRRMEAAAAYAGGCVTGALCVQPPGSAFQYLLNVCIGITAMALMPARWLVPEPEDKTPPRQAQRRRYPAGTGIPESCIAGRDRERCLRHAAAPA